MQRPDVQNLNVDSFEDIIHYVNLSILSSVEKDNINIDISSAKFLDPYSIINLCMAASYARRFFPKVSLTLPKDPSVTNYLTRIDFFNRLPDNVEVNCRPKKILETKDSDVLLELTPIRKQDDVANALDYCLSKIGQILTKHLNYTGKDIASFCTALGETCQNIVDHSRAQGLVAVQKYHAKTNFVIITVCDNGIGIKKSLSERYNVASWNDAKAISEALKLGISRLHDRGKGLYQVARITEKYKGKLVIRSGAGRVTAGAAGVAADGIRRSTMSPYFPGTQVYIRL